MNEYLKSEIHRIYSDNVGKLGHKEAVKICRQELKLYKKTIQDALEIKECCNCKVPKSYSEFCIRNKQKGYLTSDCKDCIINLSRKRHRETYVSKRPKKVLSAKLQSVKDRLETPGYLEKAIEDPFLLYNFSKKFTGIL